MTDHSATGIAAIYEDGQYVPQLDAIVGAIKEGLIQFFEKDTMEPMLFQQVIKKTWHRGLRRRVDSLTNDEHQKLELHTTFKHRSD